MLLLPHHIHRTNRIPKPRAAIITAIPQGQSPATKFRAAPAALGEGVELAELVPTGLPAVVVVEDTDALLAEGVKAPFGVADPVEEVSDALAVDDGADVVLGLAALVLPAGVLVEESPGEVPIIWIAVGARDSAAYVPLFETHRLG